MAFSTPEWGQIFTLLIVAVALGMDAFSLGIGLGMNGLPLRRGVWLSFSVGFFHMLLPLVGILLGKVLSVMMKDIAAVVGGGMLCALGIHMLVHVWKREEEKSASVHSAVSVFLFSLSVSVDSLSAGLSMGLFEVNVLVAVALFGLFGALMSGMGVLMGRYVGDWIGVYGETLGGVILLLLGSKFLF
jgi:manganese efflux pump family protein